MLLVTFNNFCKDEKITVTVSGKPYMLEAGASVSVPVQGNEVVFDAEIFAFQVLQDAVAELDDKDKSLSFKDRILAKLAKKAAEKLPEAALDVSLKYKAVFNDGQQGVVNLSDGGYSVCDGRIADFFDIVPVAYVFPRAEIPDGKICVSDARALNRKKFLRLMRALLFAAHFDIFFIELLLFFIPEYLSVKFLSSSFYTNCIFRRLYRISAEKREEILYKNGQRREADDNKKGCLSAVVKVLLLIVVFVGIGVWAVTSPPDVVISEDLQSVVCFDELYVRVDGGLPADAERVLFGDYTAYYPDGEKSYDSESYHCYIYQTSDGTRYMWLQDNLTADGNADKTYEDYSNPLVYKSEGELQK